MDQEISDVLIVIADRLGIAVDEVFGIFVGAQPLIGVISIVSNILGILTAYLIAMYVHKKLVIAWHDEDGKWGNYELSLWEPCIVVIVLIFGALVFAGMFAMFGDCVLRIIAPEYMAAKELVSLLRA